MSAKRATPSLKVGIAVSRKSRIADGRQNRTEEAIDGQHPFPANDLQSQVSARRKSDPASKRLLLAFPITLAPDSVDGQVDITTVVVCREGIRADQVEAFVSVVQSQESNRFFRSKSKHREHASEDGDTYP